MDKSNIIAHRGLWSNNSEKNTLFAFQKALENGFGIETDLRDYRGDLVISHDVPDAGACELQLKSLLGLDLFSKASTRLALNIKSSGLSSKVNKLLDLLNINRGQLYTFDMAVPDMLSYFENDINVYSRISDQEPVPAFNNLVCGLWIDNLSGKFDQVQSAKELLGQGLRVTVVSPELHGRDHHPLWDQVLTHRLHKDPNFELCTDFPHEAANIFCNSKNV